jgi:hypothetical protein
MGPFDFLNHLLNFLAPALWLAGAVTLAARVFIRKKPVALTFIGQSAINFIVSAAALGLGLWFYGHDGKMGTYTAMALLCASSQWLMLRGWRA